ncbi:MAG: diheme cytochrome c [Pegethrix bostrychoides GSE-TBD4-15B]|uniref:Diheme cytochrome c n=1 Tax=Pegethrix bostrychoides GSE-TBD4-15B TaxID=2839662 RepID=A0A951U585_9CYAN|nr:diheme cytochrome c [Pegethrix bostrychoides GSE-TBD4-15B]
MPLLNLLSQPKRLSLALLLCCCLSLGWGFAQVTHAQTPAAQPAPLTVPIDPTGTVDPVTSSYRLGQQFYLEKCATCHVGLPPAVMPSQTWAALLPDPQHYGVTLEPLVSPSLEIAWSYLSTYSRPVLKAERTPYRLVQSRYFKALHPRVEFTDPIGVGSCATCHPAAAQFNYRNLSPDWQNAP